MTFSCDLVDNCSTVDVVRLISSSAVRSTVGCQLKSTRVGVFCRAVFVERLEGGSQDGVQGVS
jgi:hypothetical protein